jgi:hypothetical protein
MTAAVGRRGRPECGLVWRPGLGSVVPMRPPGGPTQIKAVTQCAQ